MRALKSSGVSPHSDSGGTRSIRVTAAVIVALTLLRLRPAPLGAIATATSSTTAMRESHLNISRALIDSRTPGYDQLGTVWLPVLHLLCLPFVRSRLALVYRSCRHDSRRCLLRHRGHLFLSRRARILSAASLRRSLSSPALP